MGIVAINPDSSWSASTTPSSGELDALVFANDAFVPSGNAAVRGLVIADANDIGGRSELAPETPPVGVCRTVGQ